MLKQTDRRWFVPYELRDLVAALEGNYDRKKYLLEVKVGLQRQIPRQLFAIQRYGNCGEVEREKVQKLWWDIARENFLHEKKLDERVEAVKKQMEEKVKVARELCAVNERIVRWKKEMVERRIEELKEFLLEERMKAPSGDDGYGESEKEQPGEDIMEKAVGPCPGDVISDLDTRVKRAPSPKNRKWSWSFKKRDSVQKDNLPLEQTTSPTPVDSNKIGVNSRSGIFSWLRSTKKTFTSASMRMSRKGQEPAAGTTESTETTTRPAVDQDQHEKIRTDFGRDEIHLKQTRKVWDLKWWKGKRHG
ncbi:hypothetical protein HDU76_012640 [Blyttiomyces sp. JEL0837]|nr:hypothetical protein HDU76_012640 [Blyttiomyces sp. JEL0837]